jgi:hypothetical protein
MRISILKRMITLPLALLSTIAVVSAIPAHAHSCSNDSLKGNYAFTIHGQILAGPAAGLVDGIALSTFDGQGNMTQVDWVSHNGVVAQQRRPGTATYNVNADCTGSMTLANAGSPLLHLAFIVDTRAKAIHTVVTDPGTAVTSDGTRLDEGEEP